MNALVLGCSHTAGVGVREDQCYASLLADHYQLRVINCAVPGNNSDQCLQSLVAQLKNSCPAWVIAQWPNPIRRTVWNQTRPTLENIHNASTAFRALLAAGAANFYEPWIQNIITADTLCKLAGVPVVHILLEDLEPEYVQRLQDNNIVLHRDQKIPDHTWLFDSNGSDNLHHSAECHAAWTQRLIRLIDELAK
jgi:hypothetical protein